MPRFQGLFFRFRENRNLLVETGFHSGGSIIQAFNEGFSKYKGCELSKELFDSTSRRIHNLHLRKDIELFNCDSNSFLEKVAMTEPALIWLDAHFSGAGTAGQDRPDPIVKEMEILGRYQFDPKTHRGHKHIILVDDCRGRWEQIEQLAKLYFGNIEWVDDPLDKRDIAVIRIGTGT